MTNNFDTRYYASKTFTENRHETTSDNKHKHNQGVTDIVQNADKDILQGDENTKLVAINESQEYDNIDIESNEQYLY